METPKLKCKHCQKTAIYAESETIRRDRQHNGAKQLVTLWRCAQCNSQTIEIKPLAGHPHYHLGSEFLLIIWMFEEKPEDIVMEDFRQ